MSLRETFEKDKDLKVDVRREDSIFYRRVYARLTPEEKTLWDKELDRREEAYNDADLKGVAYLRYVYQSYLRDYLACVKSLDDNIGRMLDYLEKSGLAENTVVVYSSDQGFYLGEHG